MKKTTKSEQSNKKEVVQDFLSALQDPTQDSKLLPPASLWQKFWHNTRLRVGIGVLFIFVILGLGYIFLFASTGPSSAKLSDYVPKEAWVYVEFDLQSQEWQALISQAPALASGLNDFFINQGLTQGLIDGANFLALASVIEADELVWVWLLKTANPGQFEIFLAPGSFMRQPGEQVVVITTSEKIIKEFNYKKNRPQVVELEDNLWSGFFRPDLIANSFDQTDEKNIFLSTFGGELTALPEVTNFQISLTDQQLQMTTSANPVSAITAGELQGDLYMQGINFNKNLTKLETVLEQLPLANFFWQDFKQQVASEYNINWFVLREIIDKPASLAVLSKNGLASFHAGFDAVFEFEDYEMVIEFNEDLSLTEISWLKKFFQILLAKQIPTEAEVELPDGSLAYDLIMQPDSFVFSLYNGMANSNYLSIPELDMEVIMLPTEGGYILANSSQFLESYLSEKDLLELGCGQAGVKAYLSKTAMSNTHWLSDFNQAVISLAPSSLNICLGL